MPVVAIDDFTACLLFSDKNMDFLGYGCGLG